MLCHRKDITGRELLESLQFACRPNRLVEDAVNIRLHCIPHHLKFPRTYVRTLFVESFAFNIIITEMLQWKLIQLTVPTSTCQ